jgi:prevent-host-death family protein
MSHTFSATEARIHFGEVLRFARQGPVFVERDGKPEVVVISKEAYDRLLAASSDPRELLNLAHKQIRDDLSAYGISDQPRKLPSPEEVLAELRDERYDE